MSTGRSAAKRAQAGAESAARESDLARGLAEDKTKKERDRAQRLFIRQVRASQGGGFFEQKQRDTLG